MTQRHITLLDRVSRVVFRFIGSLPLGLQRTLGGAPIRIDGQALHPTAQLGLRLLSLLSADTFENKPISAGRIELSRDAWTFGDAQPVSEVRDFSITGPRGPIPLRFYRPAQATASSPLVVYYHGGGWVLGDLDSGDAMLRHLANAPAFAFSRLSIGWRRSTSSRRASKMPCVPSTMPWRTRRSLAVIPPWLVLPEKVQGATLPPSSAS